jgi:7-carboxy-7-deazaguanine synthase
MKVCEIFTSVQGESTYAGRLCTFVRLTGCNLRCTYCDTTYAYEEGVDYTLDELLREVRVHGAPLVEITGGEPLLQTETRELAASLLDEGYQVLIETNGSVDISDIDPRAVLVMDLKLPSSGMADKMLMENLDRLRPTDEVKFVIATRDDYEQAKNILHDKRLAERCTVLFSPVFGQMPPEQLVSWMREDHLPVRLNLQIHKYIWGPERRGV